jgi:hypothetical protein
MISGSAARRWGRTMAQELAYYIFLASAGVSFEAKFSFRRNTWGKIFSETLFIQNSGFDGAASCLERFFTVFLRGVSFRRKIFTVTFLQKEP